MKHINGLGKVTIALLAFGLILGAKSAQAMSAFNLSCPEKYIAKVTNVEEVGSQAFQKVEVDFQIIETLKGEEVRTKKIQVVKDGPVKFKSGETYTLEANNAWLCSASVHSKI